MNFPVGFLAIPFFVANFALATVYDGFESLPDLDYDFVIVGGGTAGNVIANRLTENPNFNILVIESGPSNEGVLDAIVPFFAIQLENTAYDWNFTTTPQSGLKGHTISYPRGHILGGSSSINGMFYTRGSSSDYDRFAEVTKDQGWSWKNLQPYIRKNEKWTSPTDHHNTTGQFDPSVHGFNGINSVSLAGFPQPIIPRVIQATMELNEEFPFNLDMNSGDPLGVGWLQATIDHGKRSSSATSYLGPSFRARSNLHVLLNSRVTRILQTNTTGPWPVFRTVEFRQPESPTGVLHRVTASKELILSAGVIGTPHILLHSGIGDRSELQAVGIKAIVHLPSVGKNLTDQPSIGNSWFVNSNDTVDNIINNATLKAELLKQWEKDRTGPLGASSSTHISWSRIPDNSSIFEEFSDPAAGANTPHLEFIIGNGGGFTPDSMQGHFLSIGTVVVTPKSRGSVTLNTSNPFDQPLINPAYYDSGFDIFAMRESIKSATRFLSAPAWRDYVLDPVGALVNATTDELLDDYIRESTFSSAHPVGTAGMSAKGATYGVVDPDLRVKGVSGLRVIDASVMPFVTCGHTQAPVYFIAERGADLIKNAWKTSS